MPVRSECIEYVPATAEYVLAVFRDQHRHQCEIDREAEPEIDLSFDSTVAEWRLACDLLLWRKLGRALNEDWEIHRRDDEWEAALEPAKERRLRGVCRLIAATAEMPRLKAAHIGGVDCRPAGAFLALRDVLASAGVDAGEIAPSTPVAGYARQAARPFIEVSRLVPGALPTVTYRCSAAEDVACWTSLALMLALIGGVISAFTFTEVGWAIAPVAILAVIGAMQLMFSVANLFPPREVRFGDLVTFRDLAVRLAEHAP